MRSCRFFVVLALASLLGWLAGCSAVKDTGELLYQDTATDSFDGRYSAFNQFLNRVSSQCNGYPIGNGTVSTLISTDSNLIDSLSRLFEGKISRATFTDYLTAWYPGTETPSLAGCILSQLPKPKG